MTQTTVATKIHKALDVHRYFTTQITLDEIVAVNHFADLKNFGIGQLIDATLGWQVKSRNDLFGLLRTNAVNILQRDDHALVRRNVDASYTGHQPSPCRLLFQRNKSGLKIPRTGGGRPTRGVN